VDTLSLVSNAVAAALLLRLWFRHTLPWFRALLIVMLAQAAVLTSVPPRSRAYAIGWVCTEPLLVLLEAGAVLEVTNLLIQGRLNTTLGRLRGIGIAIWAVSFSVAIAPLLWESDPEWALAPTLLFRARCYAAAGMLVFLSITAWILVRQPVKVARGLVRHVFLLAANFGVLASSMFLANYLPQSLYYVSQVLLLGGTAIVFAVWIGGLWKAPMTSAGTWGWDAEAARRATEEYREFRDQVRSLRD
jgi:hypothetical protein